MQLDKLGILKRNFHKAFLVNVENVIAVLVRVYDGDKR